MTPETKKTLIYGGVISFAVGAGLYIWSRYQDGGAKADGGTAAAQAQAEAAATNQETQLAELQALSGGGGGSLPSISLGSEAPPDNFAHEIAAILQATGLGAPTNAPTGTPPPTPPVSGLPQPTPPPTPVDGSPAVHAVPIGPEPGSARKFNHILADPANYPTVIQ